MKSNSKKKTIRLTEAGQSILQDLSDFAVIRQLKKWLSHTRAHKQTKKETSLPKKMAF